MIIYLLKGSFKYCFMNKKSFMNVVILAVLLNMTFFMTFIPAVFYKSLDWMIGSVWCFLIYMLLVIGYGLVVTRDLINGGNGLPKMFGIDTLKLGFKGLPAIIIYASVQLIFLDFIAKRFNFPSFDLEEMILNYSSTMKLFFTHDPVNTLLFFTFSCVFFYVSTFFLEIALAQLADSGKLLDAFNISLSFENISKIGWKNYALDITYVALSFVILTSISDFTDPYPVLNIICAIVVSILLFVIQFGAIGITFRDIKRQVPE